MLSEHSKIRRKNSAYLLLPEEYSINVFKSSNEDPPNSRPQADCVVNKKNSINRLRSTRRASRTRLYRRENIFLPTSSSGRATKCQ